MKKSIFIVLLSFITASIVSQNIYNILLSKSLSENNFKDAEYWIKKGADINCIIVDTIRFTPLLHASYEGDILKVDWLLKNGANVNTTDQNGCTPIMYAALKGNLNICFKLYTKGTNLKLKDLSGDDVFSYADKSGNYRLLKFLENPNLYDSTPELNEFIMTESQLQTKSKLDSYLISAVEKNQIDSVIYWIKNGADVNCTDSKNNSLLYKSLYNNDIFKMLLENGANPNFIMDGATVIIFAAAAGNLRTTYLLYIYGANINFKVKSQNKNAYEMALEKGYLRVADFLKNSSTYSENPTYDELMIESDKFKKQGLIPLAIDKLEKALFLSNKELSENHISRITLLNKLGALYVEIGSVYDVIRISEHNTKYYKSKNGEASDEYLEALNLLALGYMEVGQYDKSQETFDLIIKTIINYKLENTSINIFTLRNLIEFAMMRNEFSKAIDYSAKALKIALEETTDSKVLIRLFETIGDLSIEIGLIDEAEKWYNQALLQYKDCNLNYVSSLNNISIIYSKKKNYKEAELIYLQSLNIIKDTIGVINRSYNSTLMHLIYVLHEQYKFQECEPYYRLHKNINSDLILNNLPYLTEKERTHLWSKKNLFWLYSSFVYLYYKEKNEVSGFSYDSELFSKSFLLNTSIQIQNTILQSGDTLLINSWEELKFLKRQIDKLQQKPIAERQGLSELETKADKLDKELTKRSQLYKQSKDEMKFTWQDVQKSLQPNEAAIEFVNFRYFNRELTDSMLNYALVLKKDSKYPELIPLFEDKQLDSLFVKSVTDVNQLYSYRVTNLRKDTVERTLSYGSKLYNLVWKPLEASLNGIKTVYYAPSGKLNQVAFAAIPVDSTLLLSDKYNLHQVTSTRQVIKNSNATNKLQEAALFGGIQYELDNKQLAQVQTANATTNYRSIFVSDSTQRSSTFKYLKGTDDEVKGIANEFSKKGLTDQLYTGAIASEAAFKKLNGTNTDIIHIATHGFYLPVEETKREDFRLMGLDSERRNVVVKNPLLRSGLVMAGANRAWRGDSIPDNWEDGILTAHEISQINLTNTELVVLSACETGLGDNGGSEGVFGLQRAFKMAGVQTIIMSLWKVPDTQTSQLMQGFYKYWLGGMTKHDAFKKAQNEVLSTNPNPYYWAAFVMVD